MLNPNIRKGIDATPWNRSNNRGTEWALEIAIEALYWDSGEHALEAAKLLMAVLDQRGCEHLDPAVTDGKLTHAIDVIVHG